MLPGDAGTAIQVITGLGGRGLVVGGWVRDQFLGVDSKDIDIEVHDVEVAQLHAGLAAKGRVDAVGVAFGVLKFGADVDVSFPRRDSKVGTGHTGFQIEFDPTMTPKEAARRRDFTINAMAYDPLTGEVVDPFGGQQDLKDKVLRATDPRLFGDDPLRVLRGIQFAARFGFTIEPKTAAICEKLADEFKDLAKERVWTEWEKLLTKGTSLQAGARALTATGWDRHFPDFTEAGAAQADRALAGSQLTGSRRSAVALGASFRGEPDRLAAHLKRIDAPQALRHASARLSKTSQQLLGTTPTSADAEARQLARSLGRDVPLRDWLRVHPSARLSAAARRLGVLDAAPPALLTGEHLKGLGWTPGPRFGTVLREAQAQQDLNGWETADEALAWLRNGNGESG